MKPPTAAALTIALEDESFPASFTEAVGEAGFVLHRVTEATAVKTLSTWLRTGLSPTLVLISEGVPKPTAVARLVHRAVPSVQIVFLASPEQAARLRGELRLAGIGHYWSIVDPNADPSQVVHDLGVAARATQKRSRLRTTLDRMNVKLQEGVPATDPAEFRRLVISDRYLATILDQVGDAIISVDALGRITTWNLGAEELFGLQEAEALERPITMITDEARAADLMSLVDEARAGEATERHEIVCVCEDGGLFDAEVTLAPVLDDMGRAEAVSLVVRDVTERKRQERKLLRLNADLESALARLDAKQRQLMALNEKLEVQATTDHLTGLKNRMVFHNSLTEMIAVAERQQTPLSLLMVDIDHFKRVNDTFGHLEGDRVLRSIANALEGHVRNQDVVGRFGGEEFVVLLPNTTLEDALTLAESIRRTCANLAGLATAVTVSIGAAQYRPGEPATTFLDRADAALYRAKGEGRDRVATMEMSS